MNAAQVYDALIATLEALDPVGGQQTSSDRFRATEHLGPSSGARAFDLVPRQGPAPAGETARGIGTWGAAPSAGADSMSVTFLLAVLYPRSERRRALEDSGALWDALISIPGSTLNQTTYSGQIHNVQMTGIPWLGFSDPARDGQVLAVLAQWEVTVRYDGRTP